MPGAHLLEIECTETGQLDRVVIGSSGQQRLQELGYDDGLRARNSGTDMFQKSRILMGLLGFQFEVTDEIQLQRYSSSN